MKLSIVGRRMPWWARLITALGVLAVAGFTLSGVHLLPGFSNPFGVEDKDRSAPAILKSIQDMNRFEGSSGTFQVIVDLEKDAAFLPDAIRGKRTLFVGVGSVDAYVDLSAVGQGGVTVSPDRASATVRLPHAALEPTTLDPAHSYVYSQQRGIFDRLGDFFSDNPGDQQQLHQLAAQKIQDAAKASQLDKRAEANTRSMLTQLLTSLGFTHVAVTFTP